MQLVDQEPLGLWLVSDCDRDENNLGKLYLRLLDWAPKSVKVLEGTTYVPCHSPAYAQVRVLAIYERPPVTEAKFINGVAI